MDSGSLIVFSGSAVLHSETIAHLFRVPTKAPESRTVIFVVVVFASYCEAGGAAIERI